MNNSRDGLPYANQKWYIGILMRCWGARENLEGSQTESVAQVNRAYFLIEFESGNKSFQSIEATAPSNRNGAQAQV